jgi:hypothetical protein
MKIRNGFVSNSSSSSFICCLTGEMASGMDLSLSDVEMAECQNGHQFLEELLLNHNDEEETVEKCRQLYKEYCSTEYSSGNLEDLKLSDEDFIETYEDFRDEIESGEVSPLDCPVCQFTDLPWEDVAKWYLMKNKLTRKQFASSMRQQYKNYQEFSELIKDTK